MVYFVVGLLSGLFVSLFRNNLVYTRHKEFGNCAVTQTWSVGPRVEEHWEWFDDPEFWKAEIAQ
jgi:hypothetical protein